MEENDLRGLVAYDFEMPKGGEITYADMQFKSFQVREVYINGRQTGEYHVKPVGKSHVSAVMFLKARMHRCSIGLIDPSGLLNLEYPIYIVCKNDPMVMEAIPQIFEQIDEEMNETTVSQHRNGVPE